MTPSRHPLNIDHVARGICPNCTAPIPEDDHGTEFNCPNCGQRVRYQTLEERLMFHYSMMRDLDHRLETLERKLMDMWNRVRSRPGDDPAD